ncbi:MAG: cytochrome c oxidase subunit 2 [Anaerolineaceae bacterium]|nr:MAG: cytochrome c oxidase subunit 2 [Anaerolineaceae bacterium]HRQ32000.1 cytochrome c oxidase subunit II [Anaerolineales bacterium]
MRKIVALSVAVLLVTWLLIVGLDAAHVMPVEASTQAVSVDWMWKLMEIVMSFLTALILVPMFYSLVVFRRRKGETGEGVHVDGNTKLELIWTAIPLVAVVVFAILGGGNLADVLRQDPNAMVVKVTGHQWSWKFEYPADPETGLTVVSDELHLPVGQQVLLLMTSSDVIHSFWVPEFRLKQDLVPGRFTKLTITPSEVGNYAVRCAELCGTSHAYMENPVIVSTRDDYSAWLSLKIQEAKVAATDPVGFGEILVKQNGCVACHSITGAAGIGPTWLNLFGATVKLSDGTTVTADQAYLTESIKEPQAKIVASFTTQMPTYGFTDDQIAALVAYIETLK